MPINPWKDWKENFETAHFSNVQSGKITVCKESTNPDFASAESTSPSSTEDQILGKNTHKLCQGHFREFFGLGLGFILFYFLLQ